MKRSTKRALRKLAVLVVSLSVLAVASGCQFAWGPMRDVLLVGNTVSGTVSFIDGRTFRNLGSVNVIPDIDARLAEINADWIWSIGYSVAKQKQTLEHREPGVGAAAGNRFVDDVFVSPSGYTLYVSRSNLADVVAIDLTRPDHPIMWRHKVEGFHADHATLSADGSRIVVSATTGNKAEVLDANTGNVVGTFPTGNYPHQNDYSADGRFIYNASIGDVSLSYDQSWMKGARQLTKVDAGTLQVVRTFPFDRGIRPAVFTPDDRTMYAQLSYLGGLVEFDLVNGSITRTVTLPASSVRSSIYPTFDDYPHDSAHHGLAMSGDRTKLCVAGTIDDYAAILSLPALSTDRISSVGALPYWATTSADGNHCFVSNAGSASVSVLDYRTGTEITRVPVGTYPARNRLARVPESELAYLSPAPG